MAKSTYDTWVAGARELAVLIAFSVVFGLTQNSSRLSLMSSPSCVSMERRGLYFNGLTRWENGP